MILFKENDNAYIAISAYEFTFYGQMCFGMLYENAPVFKTGTNEMAIMAVCGQNLNAIADALRYEDTIVCKNISEKAIRNDLSAQIKMALSSNELYYDRVLQNNTIVYGKNGRLFVIVGNNCVFEVGDHYSVGNAEKFECALLENSKHLHGEERIKTVYRIREKYYGQHQFPIVYMDTKTCTAHLINKED